MEVLHHLQAQRLPMEDLISWSDHLNNAGHSPLYAGNPWDVNAHVLHAGKDDVCRCFCKMMVAALAQVLMMEQMLMDSLIKMVLDATAGVGITARASRWWRKEWWIQSKEPTRQAWSGDEMQ